METICKSCGTAGEPKTVTPGSILIEIFLWLMFLLPGVVYSVWRLTARHRACRSCGGAELVPLDSPIGRRLLSENPQQPKASKQVIENEYL